MGVGGKAVLNSKDGTKIAKVQLLVGLEDSDYSLRIHNSQKVGTSFHFKVLKSNGSYEIFGGRIEAGKEYQRIGTGAAASGYSYIDIDGYPQFKIKHTSQPSAVMKRGGWPPV